MQMERKGDGESSSLLVGVSQQTERMADHCFLSFLHTASLGVREALAMP